MQETFLHRLFALQNNDRPPKRFDSPPILAYTIKEHQNRCAGPDLRGVSGMPQAGQAAKTKTIAVNRQARHEYFVVEALETGIALVGTEVKSLRAGTVNLKDAWVEVANGELLVQGMHISPYEKGNIFNRDPLRPRKLLAHKNEIRRLAQQVKLQGYTLVPLSLYFKHGRVKLELGLCKGKKLYDKRASAAARDAKRDIDRALKSQSRA